MKKTEQNRFSGGVQSSVSIINGKCNKYNQYDKELQGEQMLCVGRLSLYRGLVAATSFLKNIIN